MLSIKKILTGGRSVVNVVPNCYPQPEIINQFVIEFVSKTFIFFVSLFVGLETRRGRQTISWTHSIQAFSATVSL